MTGKAWLDLAKEMNNKEQRYNSLYMDIAKRVAQMSYARRLQVGAVAVKDGRIISMGFNGMPSGWDEDGGHVYKTKPQVLHAERNALDKMARSTESGDGADLFVTHAPCLECAKSIYGAGIKRVFFGTAYRSTDGVEFLEKCGVMIENFSD
jgi:dCMP deaminase